MTPSGAIKVGITGGIGSGKSVVCRMFGMLGAPIYDSDAKAKELMSSDPELIDGIKQAFGAEAYRGGEPDRAYLASKVFNSPESLQKLNSLVHPAVMRDFARWSRSLEDTVPYLLMESAIIFDNNLEGGLDYTVTVSAPAELRIQRAMERDNAPRNKIEERIANQLTDAEREKRANFVIHNDGKESVWEQVLELDRVFRAKYEK